jgi:flagellar protein FlaI
LPEAVQVPQGHNGHAKHPAAKADAKPKGDGAGEAAKPQPDKPDYVVLKSYKVSTGAGIEIRQSTKNGAKSYTVIEPPLTQDGEAIFEKLKEILERRISKDRAELPKQADQRQYILEMTAQAIKDWQMKILSEDRDAIDYYLPRDFVGFGKADAVFNDTLIEDISCDGVGIPLFVFHREFESLPSSVKFPSDDQLNSYIIRLGQISGKTVTISQPILDTSLPGGHRLQATLGTEVTSHGGTFTIRRFRDEPLSPIDLLKFGTMNPEMIAYFWMLVESGQSMIFAGGTASGKTTGLNAISQFIPNNSKVVSIEDTREIDLIQENWIPAITRPGGAEGRGEIGMFALLKASLRQRPEYIVVGEVRGEEANVAFQAMATGHAVYATMHADSASSVVYRLENEPINIPRLLLVSLNAVAIQRQTQFKGKRVRRVVEIMEILGIQGGTKELLTNKVFEWQTATDTFRYMGNSDILRRWGEKRNLSPLQAEDEWRRRSAVIKWMLTRGNRTREEMVRIVRLYGTDPDAVYRLTQGDLNE